MSELRLRPAGRALVVDDDERVLLVRFEFAEIVPIWGTVGGGLQPGESHEEATLRELVEETGLEGVDLGAPVWVRTAVFPMSARWDGQSEVYFLVRTPPFEPQPQQSWAELNSEGVTAIRWWSLDEIEQSEERFAPRALAALLRALLRDGRPAEPIEIGL